MNKKSLFHRIFTIHIMFLLFVLSGSCSKTTEKTVITKPVYKKPADEVIIRLGINMLKSETLNTKQVKIITIKLYKRLLSIKGEEYITLKEIDGSKISVNRQLHGIVNKLHTGYSLSVKILDDEKGRVLYNRTAVVYEDIELDYTINSIAEDISGSIW